MVAPATADLLAKAAHGLADDLLTNTLLTARCPVVFAPAMHTEMWEHPATQANVATLRARGALVIEPAEGRLTGADTGKGRLPEPGRDLRGRPRGAGPRRGADLLDLAGRQVVVSAGGTREYLDPVRFLGNRSSGLQGYALARAAAARGAEVTLVAANVDAARPGRRQGGARRDHRRSCATRSLAAAADRRRGGDGRRARRLPARPTSATPRSRRPTTAPRRRIELTQNPDILAEISHDRVRARQRRSSASPPRPATTTGSVLELGPRQAGPQGLRPAGRQRRQRGRGLRQPRQRGRRPRRRRRGRRRPARLQGGAGARRSGTEVAGAGCVTG